MLDRLLESSREDFNVWFYRSSIAACVGDKEEYERCCVQIAQLAKTLPEDKIVNIDAAEVLASFEPDEERLAQARDFAEYLSEKWPDHWGALHGRAQVLYSLGDVDGCEELLAPILVRRVPNAEDPFRIRVALLASQCAANRGDQEQAAQGLKAVCESLETLYSSGDLGHVAMNSLPRSANGWVVAQCCSRLREAETAIHGEAVTPPLTPLRLAELGGISLPPALIDIASANARSPGQPQPDPFQSPADATPPPAAPAGADQAPPATDDDSRDARPDDADPQTEQPPEEPGGTR